MPNPTEDSLFFKGVAKNCSNCFFYRRNLLFPNDCTKHPQWTLDASLTDCQYRQWQPNHKLHYKKQ